MIPVLDALVAWRRAAVPTIGANHVLETDNVTGQMPGTLISAVPVGPYAQPVAVPLTVTEVVSADVVNDSANVDITSAITALRALSGKAFLSATSTARIHSHVLIGETLGKSAETGRRQATLTWRVVASWA